MMRVECMAQWLVVGALLPTGCGGEASPGNSEAGTGGSTGAVEGTTGPETSFGTTSSDTSSGTDASGSGSSRGEASTSSTGEGPSSTGSTGGSTSTGGDSTGAGSSGGSTGDSGSSGSTGSTSTGVMVVPDPVLYPASFNPASDAYEYGFMSQLEIPIEGAPDDADFSVFFMLYDNAFRRLYIMREGTEDTLYAFAYDEGTEAFELGLDSPDVITITGAPVSVDMTRLVATYHTGQYRLFSVDPSYGAARFYLDAVAAEFQYTNANIPVAGYPAETDWDGSAMVYSDNGRLYAWRDAAHTTLVQGAFNSDNGAYTYGFQSLNQIPVTGFPADANMDDFAMLHDDRFRLYVMSTPEAAP